MISSISSCPAVATDATPAASDRPVSLRPERRGQAPVDNSGAPGILHIDLAEHLAQLGYVATPPETPAPLDAMEAALLVEARKCASGDRTVPVRRELIAVALREVDREIAWRDEAEARALQLQRENDQLRHTRQGALLINAQLLEYLSQHFHCAPTSAAVLDRIRAAVEATDVHT